MSSNLRELLEDDQGLLVRRWLSSALRPTPGHTPGHQSLFGRLPHGGPVILSGDAAHSQDNLAHPCAPAFNADRTQTKMSIDKLRVLSDVEGIRS